ncbi:hypothetical protein [uncultured Dubosiella sp.]|uniref:hypothetical protein n=1 Tax=uncultured Dubosiella sp. TaxID=1937011 RepID=UPI00272E3522|nr:hypothetical protein [uncultured Dubosiella sp.]
MEFSFKNRKKKTLRIEMADGTKITLPETPVGKYKKLFQSQENLEGNEIEESVKLCAEILNTNLEGEKFTPKMIADDWTMADMTDFVQTYVAFATGVKEEKN